MTTRREHTGKLAPAVSRAVFPAVGLLACTPAYAAFSAWEGHGASILLVTFLLLLEGALIAYLMVNIRMRKRADRELRDSELGYRTVADFTYDWEYWVGADGTLRYTSPSCERVTGYSREEFLADPGLRDRIVVPQDRGIWDAHRHDEPEGYDLRFIEFRIVRKDGAVRWVEHTCVPVSDREGGFLGYRASNRDITDRKAEQDRLALSEANLRRAQEVAVIGGWNLDLRTGDLSWTDGVYGIFGLPPGTRLDYAKFLATVHPDDIDYVNRSWNDALKGLPYDIEHRIVVNGSVKWVREKAEVEFSKSGAPLKGSGVVQDITRRKLAQEEQNILRRQLAHVSRVATAGELTAALAHEINQPLAAILANAQAALHIVNGKEPDLVEIHAILNDIIDDNKRAREVVRRVRALFRKEPSKPEKVDVNRIILDAVRLVEQGTGFTGVSVRTELAGGAEPVMADRVQLEQVVINLLVNAMEAVAAVSEPPRSIVVGCRTDSGGEVVVFVRDTGKGIDEESMRSLFEPFYTTKEGGMGLGLSISRSIIEAHGGRMSAHRNPDRGATFSFSLPAADRKAEAT